MGYNFPGTRVDLGGGRGWLDAPAAASIFRIDRAIGHRCQISEAGRTWDQQNVFYRLYLSGKGAIALDPDTPSEHQKGKAVDSNEAQQFVALMEEHGWRRTVYRWVNGVWTLVERWHFEYFAHLDQHINDPAPTSAATPAPIPSEEDEMLALRIDAGPRGVHLCTLTTGVFRHLIEDDNPERVRNIVRSDDAYSDIGIHELNTYLWTYGCRTDIWLIAEKDGRFEFQVKTPDEGGIFRSGGMWHR